MTYTVLWSLGKTLRELRGFREMLSCLIWLNLSPNRAARGPMRGMQLRWSFAPYLQAAGAQSQKTTLLRLPRVLSRPGIAQPGRTLLSSPQGNAVIPVCVSAELMSISEEGEGLCGAMEL